MISSPPLFIGAIACLFLGHVLKAARWGLFIVPFQAVRKAHLFRSLAIGFMWIRRALSRVGLLLTVSVMTCPTVPWSRA